MKSKLIGGAVMLFALGSLTACDVEQTEEGKLPDVDVSVEGGNMPEYDVETADVSVGMKEKEVEVPDVDVDVDTETKTVKVPTMDVNMPDDDDE